ncbi:MAG: NAD-dependent epimerase/dehydratase family protein [Oscillospiraceae bacterium]|nr:NAD-dependent epimerase/dehydratase family protein [Oscillospiraceae bacterium]
MNILVIGGSNFIGWRFVEFLGKTNHTVTVINRGNRSRSYPHNVIHRLADRNDHAKMKAIVGNASYDAVYDMCGFVESDMKYTVELFSGRTKKYVFISTAATYIEPEVMPIPESYPQGVHGIWGKYGGGKLACEKVLLTAHEENGFPAVIVRPSYVYGVGNTIDRETFLYDRITNGRTILVPSSGEAVIQLGEVTDLCRALLAIAVSSKGYGQCYNISGSELITLNALIHLVSKIIGKDYRTVFINPKDYGMTDREVFPFDNSSYFTSCEKFSADFGWQPEISLVEGLSNAYQEWLNSSQRIQTKYEKEDSVLIKL